MKGKIKCEHFRSCGGEGIHLVIDENGNKKYYCDGHYEGGSKYALGLICRMTGVVGKVPIEKLNKWINYMFNLERQVCPNCGHKDMVQKRDFTICFCCLQFTNVPFLGEII